MEAYDVVVLRDVRAPREETAGFRWVRLGVGLQEAQRSLCVARAERKVALVVPVRYRDATVAETEARRVVEQALRSLPALDRADLSALSSGSNEGACWHFSAQDYSARARDLLPRERVFLVDRLDGHLWSAEESAAFYALSATP